MKQGLVTIVIVLFCYVTMQAQQPRSESYADSPGQFEFPGTVVDQSDFIDYFNINKNLCRAYVTLAPADLFVRPVNDAGKSGITIPEDKVIEVYDYYPKYAMYAVKYGSDWGFILATGIRPVQDEYKVEELRGSTPLPEPLVRISPVYPTEALEKRISGAVVFRLLISKTGAVKKYSIEKSIPGLDSAAIEVVTKLKFKPARINDKPVDVWIEYPVKFGLPAE